MPCGPGTCISADGWKDVLEPVIARYRNKMKRRYFRGDAAFANPEVYELLEAEGYKYTIRLPAQHGPTGTHRLAAEASSGPAATRGAPLPCQLQLPSWFLDQTAPGRGQGGVASGRTLSA